MSGSIWIILEFLSVVFKFLPLWWDAIQFRATGKISWRDIERAFQKIQRKIDNYDPDVIIGLADGVVIAGIIATNFCFCTESKSKYNYRYCFTPYYTLGVYVTPKGEVVLLGKAAIPNLSGKRVLLVDDHIYTGVTMRKAIKFLEAGRKASYVQPVVLFAHEVRQLVGKEVWYARKLKGKRTSVPWSYTENHYKVYGT